MDSEKQTTPTGYEMPIPTREEWERTLRKVAKPKPKESTPSDGPEKQ